jgi:hypothetical protein
MGKQRQSAVCKREHRLFGGFSKKVLIRLATVRDKHGKCAVFAAFRPIRCKDCTETHEVSTLTQLMDANSLEPRRQPCEPQTP